MIDQQRYYGTQHVSPLSSYVPYKNNKERYIGTRSNSLIETINESNDYGIKAPKINTKGYFGSAAKNHKINFDGIGSYSKSIDFEGERNNFPAAPVSGAEKYLNDNTTSND